KVFGYKISKTIKDFRVHKILFSIFVTFLCWMVVIVAPGNYVRLSMDEFVSPNGIAGYLNAYADAIGMFFYYLIFYMPYYFILGLLFAYAGFLSCNYGFKFNMKYRSIILLSII